MLWDHLRLSFLCNLSELAVPRMQGLVFGGEPLVTDLIILPFTQAEQAPHVALDTSMLNGKPASNSDEASAKRIVSIEDQIHSADVSVSGGSDTDASRADWSRQKDGDRGHVRSASSAKKLTTFKAVSVNKKFLASKASPSNAVQRPNDKLATGSSTPPPASITPSASRPRLIAKTGSGARETAPRLSSVVNGGKAASAPDPSAVWNKNRRMRTPLFLMACSFRIAKSPFVHSA